ncbi:MAG: hypothetical protein AAFZ09_09780 [Pseudomonadota bacterium]
MLSLLTAVSGSGFRSGGVASAQYLGRHPKRDAAPSPVGGMGVEDGDGGMDGREGPFDARQHMRDRRRGNIQTAIRRSLKQNR